MMRYEKEISYYKSGIADAEDVIICHEQALRGRGESTIIRYY